MDTVKLELPLPGMIDGDPEEVEDLILEALYDSLDQWSEWIDDVTKQIANAERTRILAKDPAIPAENLRLLFMDSKTAGSLARLRGSAKALVQAAHELRRT